MASDDQSRPPRGVPAQIAALYRRLKTIEEQVEKLIETTAWQYGREGSVLEEARRVLEMCLAHPKRLSALEDEVASLKRTLERRVGPGKR